MPYNRLRFWKDSVHPSPPTLSLSLSLRRRNTSLCCPASFAVGILPSVVSTRNGTLPISGTIIDFYIADNEKLLTNTTLLRWLFGIYVKHSWMSSSDMAVSALSLRLYRKQLWWGIIVRMRHSWWQDWVGSFNSTATKWFWGPASPLFRNRIYLATWTAILG